jgi:negative regulator of sigma-B (phosphoserine phosphatase)
MDLMKGRMLDYSSTIRPFPGEAVSGDTVIARRLEDGMLFAIIDVLGHGPDAHKLTLVIESYLARFGSSDVETVIKNLHQHLQGSRGAAVGLCAINTEGNIATYVGIGNTGIRRFGQSETRLVSQDGVVGQKIRSPLLQKMELHSGDVVLLYTDGISDRFTLQDYPSVLRHTAGNVASNIVQRYGKNHDDAACIAIRCQA